MANCQFAHSGSATYGENLCLGYATWQGCVDAWLGEESSYNYGAPGFSEATGHFTQCVWKATAGVGCAKKDCPGGVLMSCNYSPPGNVIGQFQQNVLPPQK